MRLVGALLLVPAGAATSLATVALHARWWGLLLGAAATVAAMLALGSGWATRLPYGLGWVGTVAVLAPTRPEGDFLISAEPLGYTLLALTLAVLVWTLATLPRPRRGREAVGRNGGAAT